MDSRVADATVHATTHATVHATLHPTAAVMAAQPSAASGIKSVLLRWASGDDRSRFAEFRRATDAQRAHALGRESGEPWPARVLREVPFERVPLTHEH